MDQNYINKENLSSYFSVVQICNADDQEEPRLSMKNILASWSLTLANKCIKNVSIALFVHNYNDNNDDNAFDGIKALSQNT